MSDLAVKIKNLSYKYPINKNWAIKDISLEIPKGAFYTLIGPSGSGKSTLLTLLRGFQQEIGGEIQGTIGVFKKNVLKVPIAELGKSIGIVFQNPALQLHQLRVIDEVASAPMYQGISYEESLEKAKHLIDRILGKEFYELSPTELSSGQQQKVALAASLSLNADILLLDEPFSFLDKTSDKELTRVLSDLHKEGKTIIVSTHDISRIANISTHIGLLAEGQLIASDKPTKILYSNALKDVMEAPLFVEATKTLNLKSKPVSWEELSPKVKLDKKGTRLVSKKRSQLLSVESLSFTYPESINGVEDISLNIYKGEIFGLVGNNGSGKTTLAKLLLGLLKPRTGEIRFKNKGISSKKTQERARMIGFVTQDPIDMFFEMNVWDEVAAGPKFLDIPKPKEKAEKVLKQFNLWKYRKKHPDSISGGEKSLLGIADIIVNDTQILLLDEPEFGLDPGNWEQVSKMLLDLKTRGKSIIVITQDLEAAFFLCDRIGVMQNGRLVKTGFPIEIFNDSKFLIKTGLEPLGFTQLLTDFPDKIKLTKQSFLEKLSKKK